MLDYGYRAPVNRLLVLGESAAMKRDWPDYSILGIGPDDAAELLRMAIDRELNFLHDNELAVWAPIHAMQALGQLGVATATDPLLQYVAAQPEADIDDWTFEALPKVLGMLGPTALIPLVQFLRRDDLNVHVRHIAGTALVNLAQRQPELRPNCVAALCEQLERFGTQSEELNAFLIGDLIDLKAVEAIPLMERAYAAERVEESIVGDLEDVQIEFGLKPVRENPPRYHNWFFRQEPIISAGNLTMGKTADERRALAKQRKKEQKAALRAQQQKAIKRRQGQKRS